MPAISRRRPWLLPAQRGLQLGGCCSRRARRLRELLADPATTVLAHALDDRQQIAPLVGQRVFDPGRNLGVGVALDDPILLERPQTQRQRARADPGERALELAEA